MNKYRLILFMSCLVSTTVFAGFSLVPAQAQTAPDFASSIGINAQTTVQAIRADDFTGTFGVNTHLGWAGVSYNNFAVVQNAIAYLGVKHAREGMPYGGMMASMATLHTQNGVTFDVVSSSRPLNLGGDLSTLMWMAANMPGVVDAYEGPNEFNTNDDSAPGILRGQNSRNNFAWGPAANTYYFNGLRSHSALSGIRYVGVTTASAQAWQAASMGDMSAHVDVSSWHTYYGNGERHPAANLASGYANAHATAPSRPMWYTETGCTSASNAGYTWCGYDNNDAKLMLNVMADAVHTGAQRAYFYELLNDHPGNPSSYDTEGGFGLLDGYGNPKAQAAAIHNLMTVMADGGAWFQPSSVSYSVSGLPGGAQSMALQKSNGDSYLMFWNEGATAAPITVTLSVAHALSVYDPLIGTDPAAIAATSDHISFAVPDHPVLLRIGAAATPPPPPRPYTESANASVVLAGSTVALTDALGNAWTITSGGAVGLNGHPVPGTSSVAELAYVGHVLWQENTGRNWYGVTGMSGGSVTWNGPTTSPMP